MKRILVLVLVIVFPVCASALDGKALYEQFECHICHGRDAKGPIVGNFFFYSSPTLNGQQEDYLYEQLRDIRDGRRKNRQTAIDHLRKGANITDEEFRAIAKYISTLE